MKNKKGFTLIEIIVVIAIIGIIGVSGTVLVIKGRENSLNKKRNEAFKVFDNALDVYLADHSEILNNLYNNVEGAVVSFEVLKNEGLVPDNIIDPETKKVVDYKNNYYVLSDAVVMANDTNNEEECAGRVGINVIQSWNLNNVNSDDVLYVCTKNTSNGGDVNLNIGYAVGDNYQEAMKEPYYYKGADPNNYVSHDGKTFRILSIDTDDSITLYSQLDGYYNSESYTKAQENFNSLKNFLSDISFYKSSRSGHEAETYCSYYCIEAGESPELETVFSYSTGSGRIGSKTPGEKVVHIDCFDSLKTFICGMDINGMEYIPNSNDSNYYSLQGALIKSPLYGGALTFDGIGTVGRDGVRGTIIQNKTNIYKAKLKSCVKIKSGTGDIANPFILDTSKC